MTEATHKNKFRKIVSRRDRPAKPPLSREGIIDTALNLLSSGGLPGLSLRKIATALDTGPASLYVYVANLEDLYRLMLDRALGEVEIPEVGKGIWRERLSIILTSYIKTLLSRPGLGRLAITTMASGPNAMRLMEAILDLLREGGIDSPRLAMTAMDTLLLHFSAIAAEKDSWRDHGSPLGALEQALKNLPPEDYPNIHSLSSELRENEFNGELTEEDSASRLQLDVDIMINGILNTLR